MITLACVALADTEGPVRSHVYSAMKSRDISYEEMKEVCLHSAAYYGWPKGSFLAQVIDEQWARIQAEEA
ncbi:carboxymuconolactone decarboxylase family protein [Jatrophihabitans sp. DSM 45814]